MKAGAPCRLVYYPMGFKAFQSLNPDIVAGLPTADKAIAAAKEAAGEGGGRSGGRGCSALKLRRGSRRGHAAVLAVAQLQGLCRGMKENGGDQVRGPG